MTAAEVIALRERRRRAEIERELPKNDGGRPTKTSPKVGKVSTQAERYPDPKHDPTVDAKLLAIPEKKFEQYIAADQRIMAAAALAAQSQQEEQ